LKGIKSSSTLQDERSAKWVLLQLPSSYFTYEIFLDHVKLVNDLPASTKLLEQKNAKHHP
jgi:hypothetical protein